MVVLETKIRGATVRFHDDAYAGAREEEIERRKQQARIVCERILADRFLNDGGIRSLRRADCHTVVRDGSQ